MDLTEKQKKRVESVFHEALTLPQEQREEYVANVCAEEESVRLEAVSLLRHYESANDLKELGKPHSDLEANLPLPGRIGPYEVLGRLGLGGMGEVYLARDPRLGRKVAVKVLAPAIVESKGAMDRLRREALAASALNHPNILTVHEFGEAGDTQYIVTEYVEGKPLRELIGELSPQQAIGHARQIGEALAAAHQAGIIHRDIKPENVMVRPDGYVKVLDFGLAKAAPLTGTDTTSIQQRLEQGAATMPGMLVGTISYMSPEQVRGQEVDQRTDVWSWGVVLYEMVGGMRPFAAESTGELIAAILGGKPSLPRKNLRLRSLLARALEKSPEDRYPQMTAALADLARIKVGTAPGFQARSGQRHPWAMRWIFYPALVLVSILAAVLALKYSKVRSGPLAVEGITPLTRNGGVTKAAISRHGKYIAYATNTATGQALWLRPLEAAESKAEEVHTSDWKYSGVAFSNQDDSLFFVVRQQEFGKLYHYQPSTRTTKLALEDVDGSIAFSPDGDRIAFLRQDSTRHQTYLIVKGMELSTETTLLTLSPPDYFWTSPAWSSDGKEIVAGVLSDSGMGSTSIKLISVRLDNRQQRVLGPEPWTWIANPVWLGSDSSIVVAAKKQTSNYAQLWRVSWPDGQVTALSQPGLSYSDLAVSRDEGRLVTVQYIRDPEPWVLSLTGAETARAIATPKTGFYGLAWTPSGDLISQTESGGQPDLVLIREKQPGLIHLTHDEFVEKNPAAGKDGQHVLFVSNRDGAFHLWRANLDGTGAVRLTNDSSEEDDPSMTPDGQWVIYTSIREGSNALWKVPIGGGTPVRVTSRLARKASVSPDGHSVVCEDGGDPAKGWRIAILDLKTGNPVRLAPEIPAGEGQVPVRWSRDGHKLFFVQTVAGTSNIWEESTHGGVLHQITHFQEGRIFALAPSPDGKSLGFIRGLSTSDAVLVKLGRAPNR
ncbi:MAG TPA: protein kinase [Candidatus Angelobacter sp.]